METGEGCFRGEEWRDGRGWGKGWRKTNSVLSELIELEGLGLEELGHVALVVQSKVGLEPEHGLQEAYDIHQA